MPDSTAPPQSWPFVAREAELEHIARARTLERARGVTVHAGAGVGKSRLAREALAAADLDGALTIWVQATRSAATLPLGAFAPVLPSEVRSDDRLALLRGATEALRAHSAGRPLVLGVDDAHLLDPASAALLLNLQLTTTAFVITTVRTGEPVPDAVTALWKDGAALRLDLEPLTEEATERLVEAALGGPVERRTLGWAWARSRGNPLYLHQIVSGWLEEGAFTFADGLWTLAQRPVPSQPLLELVSERLNGLDREQRLAMELLALGEPLGLAEVMRLVDPEALIALETQGLVTASAREFWLAHPLYGEMLRAALPVTLARSLRLRLAAAVAGRATRTADDALRVARWQLDAGAEVEPELALVAARAASRSADPALAAELAQRARDGGAGSAAGLILARAHAFQKRYAEAEAVLAGLEGELDSEDVAYDYVQQRASVLFWNLDRAADAVALIERARGWWAATTWEARIEPLRLQFMALASRPGTVSALAEEIRGLPTLTVAARNWVERTLAADYLYAGRVREAQALIEPLRPELPLRDEYDTLALATWVIAGTVSGISLATTVLTAEEQFTLAVAANDHAAAGMCAVAAGELALMGGRFADARRWLAEAATHFERQDPFGSILAVRAFQIAVALGTGAVEAAADAALRLEVAADALPLTDPLRPYLALGQAWALVARGDALRAQRHLLEQAAELEWMPVYACRLAYEALRLGTHGREPCLALVALSERCDAPLTEGYAAHAAALARRDGAALLDAAERLAALGALRYAAECAGHAADAHVAAGRHDSARRAAARCRELQPDGHGAPPIVIAGLDDTPSGLTPRELQMTTLAGRGMSNAEIADRLVLSIRTVETHLYRAMQKLGVSDRRQLGA
ncbi:AAA family ATPase [Solirubrobacter sp. CPCC 204708]|uniref:LuxR C-terminal-related transcriptional regulator n=1 Tax=Solirubrobacter deserti TaxID=2282478 RepID=A0ABT4RG19_9ACTN|nr:helix-turn-helix transcriptional regulator [Solirubrobacter deserti]MBE2318203.1 AAA family ATPase [Solirubrobacter deserti]MDA0137484.1 LuxR C-terminal-related transcriptional regulator [Solirubrobacter deserti]